MDGIGIVGAGVAGLHLGMLLRRKGVPVTLYSERAPQQLGSGRLPNAVAHHHVTLSRERALGVEHWDAGEFGYGVHHHYLGGPSPVRFIGRFSPPPARWTSGWCCRGWCTTSATQEALSNTAASPPPRSRSWRGATTWSWSPPGAAGCRSCSRGALISARSTGRNAGCASGSTTASPRPNAAA